MFLYDPEKERKFDYDLPIHSNDEMLNGFMFQTVIDTYRCSVKDKTEESLKDFIIEMIDMKLRDMWENYELTRENLLKECGIKECE